MTDDSPASDATALPSASIGRTESGDASQIALRALNEYVYCPRLHHLMYVQGLFIENADTLEGSAQHRRAEVRRTKRPRKSAKQTDDAADQSPPPWLEVPRELYLGDDKLGMVGKLDAIRIEDESFVPVEYKRGAAPAADRMIEYDGVTLAGGAWAGDQVQLAAQVMLLAANGYPSHQGRLHYRASHTTIDIALTAELRELVLRIAALARAASAGPMPAPLIDSPKCVRCSLAPICLPEETNALLHRIDEPRRIVPGRDDGGCLYLVTPGARVGLSGEALEITTPDGPGGRVLLKDVASVMVMGNVQITTQALLSLMESGRSVTYATRSGRLIGTASGFATKNVTLRMLQVERARDPDRAVPIARGIVAAKIANQRTLLRRSGRVPDAALDEIERYRQLASRAGDVGALMGNEGMAARVYFKHFPAMLQGDAEVTGDMAGRNRRPPKDPVNALLSFGYALLLRDAKTACVAAGFDPMVGFLHAIRPGRPALALDLMEPFRPLVVDSCVVRLVNTRAVSSTSFVKSAAGVLLNSAGRLAFFRAYEQRMDELVTHPHFSYRMSYRRMLELEARLLGRHIEGELPDYRPLITR